MVTVISLRRAASKTHCAAGPPTDKSHPLVSGNFRLMYGYLCGAILIIKENTHHVLIASCNADSDSLAIIKPNQFSFPFAYL